MKIGFVLDDSLDKPDGVQQYILTLGHWFMSHGHEVHYLVGETKRADIPNVHSLSRNYAVRFNQNRMSTPLPARREALRSLLNQEKFDVLHVQVPYSPFLAGRLMKLASSQTAVIGTFHIVPYSWLERTASRFLGAYLWRNSRRFDEVVSVSPPAARFARSAFRLRSTVVPNTINTTLLADGKALKKYADGKLNIVFLGRLVERKGCRQLLQAIQLLHKKGQLHNTRVLICGKGPLEAELKQYVHEHHLGSLVHFEGFISEIDKPDYLASAHLAVFPSLGGESFGIVLIEAMAAGAQVVLGGNNIGYRSVLGKHPLQLITPTHTEAFAHSLKHFIDSATARTAAKRWQQAAVKQYDIETVGQTLLHKYASAIAKRRV